MSSSTKSAVSDYEHLNHKHVIRKHIGSNESDDDDNALFLKAPKPHSFNDPLTFLLNDNNSSSAIQTLKSSNKLKQFQAINNNVPIPTSWSPGINLEPNPALFVTPEKPKKISTFSENNEHGKHFTPSRKAPLPVPWSPGMQPEKSIFITPDKTSATVYIEDHTNGTSGLKGYDFSQPISSSTMSKLGEKSIKEKQTVRFDLPSSSGEDTFFDENSCLLSPVTVRSHENISANFDPERNPRMFTASGIGIQSKEDKCYNPNMYSDDSTLEESTLVPHSLKGQSQNKESLFQPSEVTLSTSAHLVDKLKELMQDTGLSQTAHSIKDMNSHKASTYTSEILPDNIKESTTLTKTKNNSFKTNSKSKSALNFNNLIGDHKNKNKDIQSSEVIVVKEAKLKTRQLQTQSLPGQNIQTNQKAGPHFLKEAVSAYHPPPTGTCIVKEPHYQIDTQEYSYPFQEYTCYSDDDDEIQNAFARPEFNSTLKYRQEIDKICEQEIDVIGAVNEKLKMSMEKRSEIQEKVCIYIICLKDW